MNILWDIVCLPDSNQNHSRHWLIFLEAKRDERAKAREARLESGDFVTNPSRKKKSLPKLQPGVYADTNFNGCYLAIFLRAKYMWM